MTSDHSINQAWLDLPAGARAALEQQWSGLATGGLPCGAAVIARDGKLLAEGRNHAYDPAGTLATRLAYPLQHTRLAHAELNALALVPTDVDHATLTLWSTQHPCSMCAAAIRFVGIGNVCYIADDLSDDSSPEAITATHRGIPYRPLGDPLWWTISNLLFLYTSAVQQGASAGNLKKNRARYGSLIELALELSSADVLGQAARSGAPLHVALAPWSARIERTAHQLASKEQLVMDTPGGPTHQAQPGDQGAVRALYRQLLDVWNRQDAQAYAGLIAEDGNIVGFDGSQMDGRAAVVDEIGRIFADHQTARYIAAVREVRLVTPDVAILRAVVGMVPPGQTDIKPDVNAIQSLVATRSEGVWRIALLQSTPAQFHGRPELGQQLTDELRQLLRKA